MVKFTTLEHNGPVFPKEYEYRGNIEVAGSVLNELAEEQFIAYCRLAETDYVKDKVFVKNFYSCLKMNINAAQKKLAFPNDWPVNKVFNMLQEEKEAKKAYRKAHPEEVEAEKKAREELKEQFGFAYIDGVKQPLGVFQIEPAGILMARGANPKKGMWKCKTLPEDITINYIGNMKNAPKAPAGHSWKEVVSNNNAFETVQYKTKLADGTEYSHKRCTFGSTSNTKVSADKKKFAKAANLIKNWDKVERHIRKGLKSSDSTVKETALLAYIIMKTGIRVGSREEANNVVGASTLKVSNAQVIS